MDCVNWNDELVGQLTKLRDLGKSYSLIAAAIGVSRNAAIGKAHRLKIPPRAPIERLKQRRVAPSASFRRSCSNGHPTMTMIEPEPEPDPIVDYRCNIYDLTNKTCRWPMWGENATHDERLYCGCPGASLRGGLPYCRNHMRVVMNRHPS